MAADAAVESASTLAPNHDEHKRSEREHGRGAGHAQGAQDQESIAARHRVVVVAIEKQRVDGGADLAFGRFHDRETQIARTVLNPEQVTGQPAVGSEHDDSRRVRELSRLLVPDVSKARGPCKALDRWLVTGQEMPAGGTTGVVVSLEREWFSVLGLRRCLSRVEADGDDVEI